MIFELVIDFFSLKPDPIISQWPMMSSPYPIIFIILGYLYFIYIAGRYMKDKPPYELKGFILYYNIIQILANTWIIKNYIRIGWFTKYDFICPKIDSQGSDAQMLNNVLWWYIVLKIFDYIETCVFVLRKKQNQVSVLHIYHHISILMVAWLTLIYNTDVRLTFLILINCLVHVTMYIYYFCTAYSPRIQQIAAPFKSYITTIQMIQFFGIIIWLMQYLFLSCENTETTRLFSILHIANLLINIVFFSNFYKKSYINISKEQIKSESNFSQKSQ